ncbi:hypothetical protein QJS66_11005 [Kocuria rhizophila]|nr:hypothetical protein QJS66_11005 [Kocuria rhizophila]
MLRELGANVDQVRRVAERCEGGSSPPSRSPHGWVRCWTPAPRWS